MRLKLALMAVLGKALKRIKNGYSIGLLMGKHLIYDVFYSCQLKVLSDITRVLQCVIKWEYMWSNVLIWR